MEFLIGCGSSVAAETSNSLLAKTKKHIGFVFSYNKNIGILRTAQDNLGAKLGDAKRLAEDSSHRFKTVSSTVTQWQDGADKLFRDAQTIISHHENNKSLWQNPWSRYSWSKKAWELTQEIKEKDQNAPDFGTTFDLMAQNVGTKFNLNGIAEFESRSLILNAVLEVLKDKKVSMCSICGMGGAGKTTLAKKLVQRVEADRFFSNVAMVTVSQNPNFLAIQNEIIELVGLKIEEQTMTARANKLNSWLADHRTLLVMDDVWWKLNNEDFEAVGIPLLSQSCKIVLTSRNEDECIKMGSQHNFRVGVLEVEEAWSLFREKAGIRIHDSNETARKIAFECGGLPIAIVTIATALKGKPQGVWNDSLLKLQNPKADSLGVYSRIQLSYDLLNDEEAKACFRLCCLYPEDHNIPVEDLVLYGKGLQIFENVETMAQARDRVESIVHKLKSSFLLMEGEEDEHVKMHDIIRDFSISISSKLEHPYLVEFKSASTRWPEKTEYENCSAISIWSRKLPKLPERLECPKLELLQLSTDDYPIRLSGNFLEGTEELKVLSFHTQSCVQSIDVPKKLRTLRVEEKWSYWKDHGSSQIGNMLHDNLISLEILSISTRRRNCETLEKIGWLCSLRFLDLSGVYIRYFPPGTFSQLVKLEELCLPWDFVHWGCRERNGERINARLDEIEPLRLSTIKIGINIGSVLAEKFVRSLTRFQVFYGSSFCDDFVFPPPRYIKQVVEMYDVEASDVHVGWIRALLSKCERLKLTQVRNWNNIMSLLIEEDGNRTGQLKELCIRDCQEVEYLADDAIQDRIACFSELKILKLDMIQNLKEIIHCSTKFEEACFGNLIQLEIGFCYNLKHVFPVSVCRNLRQIQSIKIVTCEEMEAIFYRDEADDGNDDQVVSSSNMEGKPKLIRMSPTPNQKPKITTCPNPCSIMPGFFGRDKQPTSVRSYRQVEEYTPKEVDLKMDTIVFTQLKTLTMMNMPNLRILYEGNEDIEMPSLQELIIRHCNNMETLSYGSLKALRLQDVEINDIKYSVEGDLNSIVKKAEMKSVLATRLGELKSQFGLSNIYKLKLRDHPASFTLFSVKLWVEMKKLQTFLIEEQVVNCKCL